MKLYILRKDRLLKVLELQKQFSYVVAAPFVALGPELGLHIFSHPPTLHRDENVLKQQLQDFLLSFL